MAITLDLEACPLLKSRLRIVIAEYEHEHGRIGRKQWAKKLGITPPYLSAIIAGRKIPDPELMFKIARDILRPVNDCWELEE